MRWILLVPVYLLAACAAYGQSDTMAGWLRISKATGDSQKMAMYEAVTDQYIKVNIDSAVHYATEGIRYASQTNFITGEALMMMKLAKIDELQGRSQQARQRYEKALRIFTDYHYARGIAKVDNALGSMDANQGNFIAGAKQYFTAIKIFESLKDYKGLLVAYTNLVVLYLQQSDLQNAEKYFALAEQASDRLPLSEETVFLYNIKADIYSIKNENEKTLETLLSNLDISNKPGLMEAHVECLTLLGNYYIQAGAPAKAMEYLQEGLQIAKKERLNDALARLSVFMAKIMKKQSPSQALVYINDAIAFMDEHDIRTFLPVVYDEQRALYKQMGNYRMALEVTERRNMLNDSLFNINKAMEIASIAAEYELDKSTARIKQLEQQSAQAAHKRNIIIWCAVAILTALIVVLVFYRRILKLNTALTESNATKDRLFSIIGHDLRGPIAVIPAILSLYEDKQTSESEKRMLFNNLKQHTNVSAETLDKLLYWGQSLISGTTLQQEVFEAKSRIRPILDLNRIMAGEKNITITDGTPEGTVLFADPAHFDFIVRNLVSNAIKYSYVNGVVFISADGTSHPDLITFSVRDNGAGIEPELLPQIFNAPRSKPGTSGEKGTGIGLMLSKEFVEKNGGRIWAVSEPENGTTFCFTLKNGS